MRSLNIKDPEVHRLAAAIAQETGKTMTYVVTEALRDRFERLPSRQGKAGVEELRAIARRAAASVRRPYLDHAEFLSDKSAYALAKASDEHLLHKGQDFSKTDIKSAG
jgi:antitoxin VapB